MKEEREISAEDVYTLEEGTKQVSNQKSVLFSFEENKSKLSLCAISKEIR